MTNDFWAQGDYHNVIGQHLAPVAEAVVDAIGVDADTRLLDVGCGTGNAALAGARRGAAVTGLDLSRGMLGHARERGAPLPLSLVHGDAQHLPFTDACFDHVVSVFAHVFAPDTGRATREMLRVARPGGHVVYTAWRGDGASGAMNDAIHHARPDIPLEALRAGTLWADPAHVREQAGEAARLVEAVAGEVAFPAPDAAAFVQQHARASPGMIGVLRPFADDAERLAAVKADLATALAPYHREGAVRFGFRRIHLTKA